MNNIFGHNYESFPFIPFSYSHGVMIVILFVTSFIIYYYQSFFRKHDLFVRIILLTSLFLLEGMYHYWLYKNNLWDASFTLPLQLCSISLNLCLILLLLRTKVIFEIVYFIGISGATMAIVTPELFVGFPHFRYFQFFITHILIIVTCLYFVFVHNYYPNWKALLKSFLFLNICAVMAFFTNKALNGNYMFLEKKPTNGSLLDYFGPYPYYIFTLEVAAFVLFSLLLIPFLHKKV